MNMPFKRPADRYGSSAPVETPYLRASREWDSRLGSAVVQARNWRAAAFASMAIAALATAGLIWQANNTKIATYIVPLDTYGRPGRIELAGQRYEPTTAQAGYFLADWVRRTRSKSIDPVVIRDNWTTAYHFVAGAGVSQLTDYAKANDPFANAGSQAVNVEVVSVLPRSPNTYQVQWRETTFTAGGGAGLTETWTGLFTTKLNPPSNEADLRANPLGLFITHFQWSREL